MPSRRCCREWMSFPMPSRQRCRCRRASRQQDTAKKAKRHSQRSSRSRTSRRLKRPKVSRGFFIASSQTGTTANLIRYGRFCCGSACVSSSARLPIWWILVHRTKNRRRTSQACKARWKKPSRMWRTVRSTPPTSRGIPMIICRSSTHSIWRTTTSRAG